MQSLRCLLIAVSLTILAGCAHKQDSTLDALIIQNKTQAVVYDVTLSVPKTGGVVFCSAILPERECSLGFPERKNEDHPARLSWTQNGQTYNKSLKGSRPLPKARKPMEAVVNIMDHGKLEVYLN